VRKVGAGECTAATTFGYAAGERVLDVGCFGDLT
jgi:hypothetical protein